MCGFITLFKDNGLKTTNLSTLKKMSSSFKHRGPDQQGVYFDKYIILAFHRLSIIDKEHGNQPFSYDNGKYEIVYNGEIYNYIELRDMLVKKGITFRTKSDTEVIMALYKHYGTEVVHHLRGMFSFIIWDKENKTLFGARDPIGIKPFYYMETAKGLYCASEAKCFILGNNLPQSISVESLHHYLSFQYVPDPKTILDNLSILPAGHTIERSLGGKALIKEYWTPKFNPIQTSTSKKLIKIREVLEESVRIHMRSDVPVGLFLSGGIDSTIITALAKTHKPDIKTFTVGFERNGYSEIELAKRTADELNVENTSTLITSDDFIHELPKIIWHMDEPVADPSAIPLYFLAREASKHVKVVLSGEGSDELFGGYNIYREPGSLSLFSNIPGSIKKVLKQLSYTMPNNIKGKSFLYRGCTPIEDRYIGNAHIFYQKQKEQYLQQFNSQYTPQLITKPLYDNVKEYDSITKMQYIDIHTWLKGDILVKADRMTMAHSLEARVPFLDKEVINVALSLTQEEKVYNGITKYLLRESFKDIIPASVKVRKKLGFPVPMRHWLKDELYEWAKALINESETEAYIKKNNVLELLQQHYNGPVDYSRKIWTILVFMLWHQIFIEKKYTFPDKLCSCGEFVKTS